MSRWTLRDLLIYGATILVCIAVMEWRSREGRATQSEIHAAQIDSLRTTYATRDSLSAAEIRDAGARTARADSIAREREADAAFYRQIADNAARGFREANARADEAEQRARDAEATVTTDSAPDDLRVVIRTQRESLDACTDARASCAVALAASESLTAAQSRQIAAQADAIDARDSTNALLTARTVEVMGERDEALRLSETINESLRVTERQVRILTTQRNLALVGLGIVTAAALLK